MRPRPRAETVVYAFLDFGEGGAQRLSLTTWRLLDRQRYQPHLLCVRRRGSLVSEAEALRVPATVLGRLRRPYDLASVVPLARLFRMQRPAIVQVPLYSRVSPYVRLAARLAGVPVVVAHEHCRGRPPSRARALADRLLVKGTRFLAVSEAMRHELVTRGVPASQITVVANGIDTEFFVPTDRATARRQLGLEEHRPAILVPARLEPRKGHADLLTAVAMLRLSCPDLLVLCAGDGPARPALGALAKALGVEEAVRWLGHRTDMADLYAAADIVCLPSRVEGLPLAILEAMACGRAVVATTAGGAAEAIEDGMSGRIVPVAQPQELARALADLLASPAERSRLAAAARDRAVARFSADLMVRRLTACYDRWLAEARSRPRTAPLPIEL